MTLLLALLFPAGLMLLLLVMDRVERTLQADPGHVDVDTLLAAVHPENVEVMVSQRFDPAVERYWRRRRPAPQGRTGPLHAPSRPAAPAPPAVTPLDPAGRPTPRP